jgi:hypothetical protein
MALRRQSAPAGYSGTPLAKKLGVKDGQLTWRSKMPPHVAEEILAAGVAPKILTQPCAGLEMAHLFVTERHDLVRHLQHLRNLLAPSGIIWVSWPKKTSKVETDLTDNVVRAEALPLGLVDVKVCAIDQVWSGLKLVIRISER